MKLRFYKTGIGMATKAKNKKTPSAEQILLAEDAIVAISRQVKFSVAEYPISVYVSRFQNDTDDRYFGNYILDAPTDRVDDMAGQAGAFINDPSAAAVAAGLARMQELQDQFPSAYVVREVVRAYLSTHLQTLDGLGLVICDRTETTECPPIA